MNFLKKLFSPITGTIDYIQNHFKAMLFLLLLFILFIPTEKEHLKPNNLQSILLEGPIFDTTQIVEELEEARTDSAIKGVMVIVDSPGGAVPPSLEVAYAIKRLKTEKPVIVYAKGTLASGGYYASIWANEIIANPGALVGSIGVILQGVNAKELMEKIGIETQVIKAGKFKQVGTPDREWTKEEKAELDKVIMGTYDMFVHDVAAARNLDPAKRSEFADAHIFTAAQAENAGLVDALGVEYDAKERIRELSGVTEAVWNEESKFDRFIKELGAQGAAMLHLYFPAQSLR